MGEPIRIHAYMVGDLVEVKALMKHAMETGRRRDAQGAAIPAHFIQHLRVEHKGRTVLAAQWGATVARNPFLHFRFKGGRPGETIAVSWTDNQGDKRRDEALIEK